MVVDSSTWRHGTKIVSEKFSIIMGNSTLIAQPKLIRLSNETSFLVLIYSFSILRSFVDCV